MVIFVGGFIFLSFSIIWIDFVDDQFVYVFDVFKIIVFGGFDSDIVMELLNFRFRVIGY